jgi:patatin-like phospholipase/acyl hydrolase
VQAANVVLTTEGVCVYVYPSINMVAGCSNGAMIAMLLAYNQDPIAGRSMLEYGSPYIFGSPHSLIKLAHWPKFDNTYLKSCCEACWGSYRLRDAPKRLVVPVYNLDNQQPVRQ